MATMASLMVEVGANISKFVGEMTKMETVAQKNARAISREFKGLAAQVGVVFSAGLFTKFLKDTVDMADELNKASQRVGVSTEALSGLSYAAKVSGASFEDVSKGLKTLSQRMTEANDSTSKSGQLMKALGIDITAGPMPALGKIADAFAAMRDGTTKTALAVELFGKSGMQLIPLLNQGSAGLAQLRAEAERLGLVVSGDTAKAMEQFNDNLLAVKESVRGVAVSSLNDLAPSMVNVSKAMKEAAAESGVLKAAWVALGGVAASALGISDTDAQRASKRMREITEEVTRLQVEIESGANAGRLMQEALIKAREPRLTQLREELKLLRLIEQAQQGAFDDQAARRARQGQGRVINTGLETGVAGILGGATDPKALAREAQKLRENDIAGWVKYIEELERQWEAEARAFEKTQDEMKEAAERMRILDNAGWVRYIEALQAKWEREALDFAASQDRKKEENSQRWAGFMDGIESGFREAWTELLSFQEGSWNRGLTALRDTFKRTLLDFIYQSLVKPFVLRIVASVAGVFGMAGAANAANAANAGNGALSFANLASGAGALFPSGALGSAFSNVAQMGWGLLGGGGASGAIIGQLASFIPLVGTLIAGVALLANFFDDGPENPNFRWVQGLGGRGAFGGITAEGNYSNAALQGFLATIDSVDQRLQGFLSEEQIQRISERLAAYTQAGQRWGGGQPAQFAFPPGTDAEAMQQLGLEVLRSRYSTVFDELNPRFAELIRTFEGTAEELATLITSMVSFHEAVAAFSDPLAVAAEAAEAALHPFTAAVRTNAEAFGAALDAFGRGTLTVDQLTQATVSYYNAQVQLLAAIRQVGASISAMFEDTVRSITMAGLSEQDRYNFLQTEAEALFARLMASNDPNEIESLAQQINRNINEAFGLLSPEDQARMREEYLQQVRATNQQVQEHHQGISQTLAEDTKEFMDRLQELMTTTADKTDKAADKMLTAGEDLLAAARTEQRIVVSMPSTAVGAGAY